MSQCSWCPERHDKVIRDIHNKSGQVAMSRHTNSHTNCSPQIRAMSACFILTQTGWSRIGIKYPFPFFCILYSIHFSNWLASDVRMRSNNRYHDNFVDKIPMFYDTSYCYIVDCAGTREILSRKIPIALVNSSRTRDDIFEKIPIFCYTVLSSISCWRTRYIDQQQTTIIFVSSQRNSCDHTHNKAFETLLPW